MRQEFSMPLEEVEQVAITMCLADGRGSATVESRAVGLEDAGGATYTALGEFSVHAKPLTETIAERLRRLGLPVLSVRIHHNRRIGLYAIAVLDCNAREALEHWLRAVEHGAASDIPVFILWAGDTDVTPEEMGVYVGRVLAKMNVFLATEDLFDVVEILREAWK